MANAGQYGVNIGMGAAGGATMGTAIFPGVGTAIGGVLGGVAGGLQTLLSSSDEAKQKKRLREALMQQAQQKSSNDWDQRWMALHPGLASDPMTIAQGYEPYDPQKAGAEADAQIAGAMPEQTPNYSGLAQSLGQLGGTLGAASRQSDAQDKLGLAQMQSSGNPWQAYADTNDGGLEELLKRSREAAWNRTGGW